MTRTLGWLLALALAIAAGVAAYGARDRIWTWTGADEPDGAVRLITVSREAGRRAGPVLTASGKIVSDHRVEVATKVSGQIVALHFEQGDQVEDGQVLARLEDVNYRARRDEAVARLAQAEANLQFQNVNFDRVKRLHQGNSAPPIELADAKRMLEEAQARVAAARAALDFAQKALDDTVVTAPISGVVLTRNVEVGDFVAAEGGIGANANARFATIADMNKLRVEVDVSELDIARLHRNMPCIVTPDAYKDREYDGHVMWLDPGANYSKATVQVKVRIEKPDDYLRVEGSAQVAFFKERPGTGRADHRRPSVWIPSSACRMNDDGTGSVFLLSDNRLRKTEVNLGRRRGDQVEVLDGLTEGQRIAVEPLNTIRDGQVFRR